MTTEQIKEKIVHFINSKIGIVVSDQTPLFTDLELIGMDADSFMVEFADEFNIDLSSFIYSEYFNEVSSIPLYYLFLKRFRPDKIRKQEFYLSHLIDVVKRGAWFDPSD